MPTRTTITESIGETVALAKYPNVSVKASRPSLLPNAEKVHYTLHNIARAVTHCYGKLPWPTFTRQGGRSAGRQARFLKPTTGRIPTADGGSSAGWYDMIRTNLNHEAAKAIDNQDQAKRLLRKRAVVRRRHQDVDAGRRHRDLFALGHQDCVLGHESPSVTHLSGYASDFFEFIAGNKLIFPDELQEAEFVFLADRAAASIVFPIIRSDAYKNENDPDKKQEILAQAIDFSEKKIDKEKFITGVR